MASRSCQIVHPNEIKSTLDVLGWDKHRQADCDRGKAGLGVFSWWKEWRRLCSGPAGTGYSLLGTVLEHQQCCNEGGGLIKK